MMHRQLAQLCYSAVHSAQLSSSTSLPLLFEPVYVRAGTRYLDRLGQLGESEQQGNTDSHSAQSKAQATKTNCGGTRQKSPAVHLYLRTTISHHDSLSALGAIHYQAHIRTHPFAQHRTECSAS